MANFADRVRDTTTTTGTGNITLAGSAPTGFRTLGSVYAVNTDRIPYAIVMQDGSAWEVGFGTLTGSTTLRRDRVLSSTNANALVSFAAGTKDVFVTSPAAWLADMMPRGRSEMLRVGAFTP